MSSNWSAEVQSRYKERGYHFPVDVLSPAEVSRYRGLLEDFERAHGPMEGPRRSKMHLVLTWLDELVHHPRILDAVEGALGPDFLCWSSSFFIKEPGDPSFIAWHQDATYWGLNATEIATAWLALSPATPESGCMKFKPATHLAPVAHHETDSEYNMLSRSQEIAVAVDERDAVHAVLRPGQASLHHVLLFHGSEANKSTDRRIGFAIRYVAAHVGRLDGRKGSATLARGIDRYGHFAHEPRPHADLEPRAVEIHDRIVSSRSG